MHAAHALLPGGRRRLRESTGRRVAWWRITVFNHERATTDGNLTASFHIAAKIAGKSLLLRKDSPQLCRVGYPQGSKQHYEKRQDGRSCICCVPGAAFRARSLRVGGTRQSRLSRDSDSFRKGRSCARSTHSYMRVVNTAASRHYLVFLCRQTIVQGCGQGSCNPTATGGIVVADLKASSEQSSRGTDPLGFLGAVLPPILARPGRRLQGYVTSLQKALCLPGGIGAAYMA